MKQTSIILDGPVWKDNDRRNVDQSRRKSKYGNVCKSARVCKLLAKEFRHARNMAGNDVPCEKKHLECLSAELQLLKTRCLRFWEKLPLVSGSDLGYPWKKRMHGNTTMKIMG